MSSSYLDLRRRLAERDRSLHEKVTSLEAAAELVKDGETVGIGGSTLSRTPMAMIWALIRARRRNLTCARGITSSEGDWLLGSGAFFSAATLRACPPTPPSLETPAWNSGWVKTDAPGAEPTLAPETPAPRFVPEADGPREMPPQATTEQRFKLARAFLDIGDAHSARELLIEIMNGDDDEASSEAAKMLSRLVGR